MKTVLTLAALISSIFVVRAQADSSYVPLKKQKYIAVGTFTNSGYISYRQYLSDFTAFRIGMDATFDKSENEQEDPNYPTVKRQTRNIQANLNIGIQSKIFRLPRLETYCGLDGSLGYANYFLFSRSNSFRYDSSTDTYVFDYTREQTESASYFTPSIKPFVGTSFYIYRGFSVGVEYRVPLYTRFYQLSKVYAVAYKDILGSAITPATTQNNNTGKSNIGSTHIGLLGLTTITVTFRIR